MYPFSETVADGGDEQAIIEKIDIGGISLIRAAAKNFKDVLIIPSRDDYPHLLKLLDTQNGETKIEQRKEMAEKAFNLSSSYDSAIFNYFHLGKNHVFQHNIQDGKTLRYGENPHQKGSFYGRFDDMFDQHHGKELSYNNLLDTDAAVNLIAEFTDTTFAILKHNNACGLASRDDLLDAYNDALAGDPVSAFGGVLITNKKITKDVAEEIDKLFCEVVIAPEYDDDALEILKSKKNRVILTQKTAAPQRKQFRSILNGVLQQDQDIEMTLKEDFTIGTEKAPADQEMIDLEFANKLAKHTKSNTIVLAKGLQLLASGTGQTSRVDALQQAINKANSFNFDLNGAVMASDAFFPFPDCVEIAGKAGITAIVQPGGSIKDKDSIEYCNNNGISMVITGIRHFKH